MNNTLSILGIVFTIIYVILMIDTLILVKKSEGKLIDDIKKPIIKRINISMILIIIIAIINIVKIIINK